MTGLTAGLGIRRGVRALLAGAGLVLAVGVGSASAQTPALDRVEELVRDGRVPEARLALEVWWVTERSAAAPAELERAIWLRARSTSQVDQAEFLLRRLVREFPDGPYAEGAAERLSLLEAARAGVPAGPGEPPTSAGSV